MFDGGNFELLFLNWKTYNESGPSKRFVPNLTKKFFCEKQKLLYKMIRSDHSQTLLCVFRWHCFRGFCSKLKWLQSLLESRVSLYSILLCFVAISISFFDVFVRVRIVQGSGYVFASYWPVRIVFCFEALNLLECCFWCGDLVCSLVYRWRIKIVLFVLKCDVNCTKSL